MTDGRMEDPKDGSSIERAEWWEGGIMWGLGLGVVADKQGLMRAFDETLESIKREVHASAADQEVEREKRRIASKYLSAGAGAEVQHYPREDGIWGDRVLDESGDDMESSSDSRNPSSDSPDVMEGEELAELAGGLMGLEGKALSSSADARRRGHSVVNFAAFAHMSVGRMNPGGRDADGGAGGGGQVKPADRELADGQGDARDAEFGWDFGREQRQDRELGSLEVPPLFPHAVPKTVLQWIQSRTEWTESDEAGCGGDGGLGQMLMLDKAALAAAEEKAGACKTLKMVDASRIERRARVGGGDARASHDLQDV